MFLGSPAWIGMLILGTVAVAIADTPSSFIRAGRRHRSVCHHVADVVCAENRDRCSTS